MKSEGKAGVPLRNVKLLVGGEGKEGTWLVDKLLSSL